MNLLQWLLTYPLLALPLLQHVNVTGGNSPMDRQIGLVEAARPGLRAQRNTALGRPGTQGGRTQRQFDADTARRWSPAEMAVRQRVGNLFTQTRVGEVGSRFPAVAPSVYQQRIPAEYSTIVPTDFVMRRRWLFDHYLQPSIDAFMAQKPVLHWTRRTQVPHYPVYSDPQRAGAQDWTPLPAPAGWYRRSLVIPDRVWHIVLRTVAWDPTRRAWDVRPAWWQNLQDMLHPPADSPQRVAAVIDSIPELGRYFFYGPNNSYFIPPEHWVAAHMIRSMLNRRLARQLRGDDHAGRPPADPQSRHRHGIF